MRDVEIYDIVNPYVTIKNDVGCCPFHNEKTGSFRINKKTNTYKCFGCGEGGDGIRFIEKKEKLTFYEAIEHIAKQHNITLEYSSEYTTEERKAKEEKIISYREILLWCNDYYRKQLKKNIDAMDYLTDRGITADDIEEWQLGYAPTEWKNITPHIINLGWYNHALELGLIKTKEGNAYDKYRNRIIVPILDKQGQITGFAGRALSKDDNAKYLNPNDSDMYAKSNIWFGWDKADKAIHQAKQVIICEGYFDVISLHKAGVENAIAGCGTNITEKQLATLRRHTDNVLLMQDSDKAGIESMKKLLPMLLKLGYKVSIADLEGKDPDELVRTMGNEQLTMGN